MKKIVLLGAGGLGREVAYNIIRLNNMNKKRYELLGFLDDGPSYYPGMMIGNIPVLGKKDWILAHKDEVLCTCTIGNSSIRAKIQKELTAQGVQFESLISDYSYICYQSQVGPGSIIYGRVEMSVDTRIGAGVLLNSGVTLGHDGVIGDFTTVMPGTAISGGCVIGEEAEIGGHVYILPGKKVGDRAKIAPGSVVFSNVKAGTTVLGNPAKRMRELE